MSDTFSALQLALIARQADEQRSLLAAEPIAVIGIGCRFPGGQGQPDLESPEAFWDFLLAAREAVTEVPASRWNLEEYYDARPGTPGKMHCRHGSFLAAPDQFDPARFGISPKEARAIDPQHRLLLEVAHEALERAGLAGSDLRGQAGGVYFGLCSTDYAWRRLRGEAPDADFDIYFATGTSFAMAPGRLAYVLGLHGPALAVDTACSSSLVAVDLACRSLRDRSTDLALAGGVSLLLTPVNSLCFARSGMMASDGHCKTFDAAADGYVRGEGCGVVVLKRLADALSAGDPILAVLRGSGVNQDGASAGLTVPNGEAQAALIRNTLRQARLSGDQIDVLEAHGTGTPLGDPIELKALAPIYGRPQRRHPLRLGSVKTNLGHLEGAAGIAGLIKAVLMVQHGRMPPHLHLRQPTPYLNWNDWSLRIPTEAESWPDTGAPRRVAVSSFGFSGTNAHVLVEQTPVEAALPLPATPASLACGDWLLLSAQGEISLRQLAETMLAWLPTQPAAAWPAICATARHGRTSHRWRLALQAGSAAEATTLLARWLAGIPGAEALRLAEAPLQPPRLAFALSANSRPEHWQAWIRHGLTATALVHGPEQAALAGQLAGTPPQLRLVQAGSSAAAELAANGYNGSEPLEEPSPEALVRLWLAGQTIDWSPLQPQVLWPRQVIPTTPFERLRCWPEERPERGGIANDTEPLAHQRSWRSQPRPLATATADTGNDSLVLLGGSADLAARVQSLPRGRYGQVVACPDLAALDTWLQRAEGPAPAQLLLLDGLLPPQPTSQQPTASGAVLGEPFWQHWLPLLQGLSARASRLGSVHWALCRADSPETEALAALGRCWAREAGPQAGGLLWCGPQGEGLEQLLQLVPPPRGGEEWRWTPNGAESAELVAVTRPRQPPGAGEPAFVVPAQATTVISGGLGALGLATARWLQSCGADHFTLLSRRPPDAQQRQAITALEQAGATVDLAQLDVADADQVQDLFARLKASARPLAGVIHAAGILDDGLLSNQSAERCTAVARPKVQGALNLERCSRQLPHQFFVAYSSVAAVLGSPGQAAYAAANGFLDGLMRQRRAQGLPGLAIAWGPWAGAGMAAHSPVSLERIDPEAALTALGRWIGRSQQEQVATVVLARLERPSAAHPMAPRLAAMTEALAACPDPHGAAALTIVERCLAELLAELGGFDAATLEAGSRLDAMGLDSLMAVELATAMQAGLGINLGLGALNGDPTLGSLAAHVLDLLRDPLGAAGERQVLDLGLETELPRDLIDQLARIASDPIQREGPGAAILLTGATGFLGAFLLADQLERHRDLTIYCLVRADGPGAAKGRVRANLEHYGLWREAYGQRLVGVPGDLAAPNLGLDDTAWNGLSARISGILHNGAQLSYVAPYGQLRAANVAGTLEVLRLATAPLSGGGQAIPLEFISSTSVYEASAYRDQLLNEEADLVEWQGIHLGYSQTKWVSERLVWQAAQLGLPVRIYRPPLIGGHSITGAWHEQDFLHRLVRGCLALRQAPDLAMALDLVPVDYVVSAVGALAWGRHSNDPGLPPPTFHLHHPQPVLWLDLLSALIERGAPLEPVPLQAWLQALAQQPSNPLYPLQPFFTHRWGAEQLTYPELNAPGVKARPTCERTLALLEPHGVSCPGFASLIDPYTRTFLTDLICFA